MSNRESVLRKAERCIDKADRAQDASSADKDLKTAMAYLQLAEERARVIHG